MLGFYRPGAVLCTEIPMVIHKTQTLTPVAEVLGVNIGGTGGRDRGKEKGKLCLVVSCWSTIA